MVFFRIIAVLAVMLILTVPANAQPLKVGVIDMQKGLNDTEEGRKELEKLKKIQVSGSEILKQKQGELKKLEDEINKQGFMLSVDARMQKEEKFRRLQRDFERYREDKMAEFVRQRNVSTAKVYKGLMGVLREYAEKEKFDIILEAGQQAAPASGTVIYFDDSVDITGKVIEIYNRKFPAGK